MKDADCLGYAKKIASGFFTFLIYKYLTYREEEIQTKAGCFSLPAGNWVQVNSCISGLDRVGDLTSESESNMEWRAAVLRGRVCMMSYKFSLSKLFYMEANTSVDINRELSKSCAVGLIMPQEREIDYLAQDQEEYSSWSSTYDAALCETKVVVWGSGLITSHGKIYSPNHSFFIEELISLRHSALDSEN